MGVLVFLLLISTGCLGTLWYLEAMKTISLAGKLKELEQRQDYLQNAYSEADEFIGRQLEAQQQILDLHMKQIQDSFKFFRSLRGILSKMPEYRNGNREFCARGNALRKKLVKFIDENIEFDEEKAADAVRDRLKGELGQGRKWRRRHEEQWGELLAPPHNQP